MNVYSIVLPSNVSFGDSPTERRNECRTTERRTTERRTTERRTTERQTNERRNAQRRLTERQKNPKIQKNTGLQTTERCIIHASKNTLIIPYI
jgi:hypothetical protein